MQNTAKGGANMKNRFLSKFVIILVVISSAITIYDIFIKKEPENSFQLIANKEENPAYFGVLEKSNVNFYKINGKDREYIKTADGANVFDLPDDVYKSLKEGIFFKTEKELNSFIELITS